MQRARADVVFLVFVQAALTLALLLSTGCGDARSPGVIITGDGRMLDNTAENTRDEAARTIVSQLQPHLGEHWRVAASIAETPVWTPDRRGEGGDWMWEQATVAIELVGDGQAPSPLAAEDVRGAVTSYMRPRVVRAAEHLAVSVAEHADAARFEVLSMPAPAAVVSPLAHDDRHARSYVVQAGDTLADISTAFYGNPQHWKDVMKANPGVDFETLRVGATLVIPALSAAPAAPATSTER